MVAGYTALPAERTLEVTSFDGTVLVADEFGPPEAPAGVVFLHGIGLDASVWRHQMPPAGMAEPWRRIFVDARGHGRSSRLGDAPLTLATFGDDVQALLQATGLSRAVLVGHSMGGMSVLEFCARYPSELGARVRGLVLVNTTYAQALRTFGPLRSGRFEQQARRLSDWVLADPRRQRWLQLREDRLSRRIVRSFGFGRDPSPEQVRFITRLLATPASADMTAMWQSMFSFSLDDQLAEIRVPTLIVAGGRDRMTSPAASRHMASRMPTADLETYALCGHLAFLEEADRFNQSLDPFLRSVLEL